MAGYEGGVSGWTLPETSLKQDAVAMQRVNKSRRGCWTDADIMSVYSANQYDGAFQPHRLQNWSEARRCRERPTAQEGHTTFIANDRGHLLPMIKRGSAWPLFRGTWALPARLPACRINPTARSAEGLNRLRAWGVAPRHGSRDTDRRQAVGQHTQTNKDEQQEAAACQPTDTKRNKAGNRIEFLVDEN